MRPDRLTVHCIAVPASLADQIRLYAAGSTQWLLSWSQEVTDLPRCDAVVLPAHMLPDLRAFQPGVLHGALVIVFGPVELLPIVLMRGAADYLRTPWGACELFARLSRRLLEVTHSKRRFGLSVRRGAVSSTAASATLSAAEYRILRLLLRFAGEVVTRQALNYAVWGHSAPESRAVDVHISSLRRKLRPLATATASCAIQAVRGEGYMLIGHDSLVDNL